MENVVWPFGILEDVLRILLDGLLRVDDRGMVGAVFTVLAGQ